MLNNVIECPICMNDINNNEGIIIFECCNNHVHLKCVMEWYSKKHKNNICFICQQVNQFTKDIHFYLPENKNIRNNLLENNSDENNDNEENKNCIQLCICGTILGTITSIMLLFICI